MRRGWEWGVTLAVIVLVFLVTHLWVRQERIEQALLEAQARVHGLEIRAQTTQTLLERWLDEQARPYAAPGSYSGAGRGTGSLRTPWGLWPE